MTKSSVDRKRSKYGEKYSLRFHKRLKTYDLSCNDETPHLIAKFVETDGDLAMRLFERLESNYKENEQLKIKLEDITLEMEYAKESNEDAHYELYKLKKENEQLKQRIKSRLHYYRELNNNFDKNDGFTYNVVKRIVEDLEDILR